MTAEALQALRYPVAIDEQTGRLVRETDYEQYVKQLIRQVLLTAQGERVHRPSFGAGLRHIVMAPNSPATASLVETIVFQALTTWLGTLIAVDSVKATAIAEVLEIIVEYTLRAR